MADEYTVCAAAFFRNKGKSVVTESEFLMGISMDLHWMPYDRAKVLLSELISRNVLVRNGEYLKPSFRIHDVEVPVAYRPGERFVSGLRAPAARPAQKDMPAPEDLMPVLISEAVNAGLEKRDFISESNAISKRLGIDILAAGLIVLRDSGADISELSERIYSAVSKK